MLVPSSQNLNVTRSQAAAPAYRGPEYVTRRNGAVCQLEGPTCSKGTQLVELFKRHCWLEHLDLQGDFRSWEPDSYPDGHDAMR